tara:strand:+ start:105 stop:428 length:324 start_codon:yes stop_codon:yes gene_type:complete
MNDDQNWEHPLENEGLTLGSEEALQFEIEKSKSLKVDRLRLRDEIEQLKIQKTELTEKNRQLHEKINALSMQISSPQHQETFSQKKSVLILLIVLILALLTIFFLIR